MREAVLLSRLQKGDSRALNTIMAQYGPYVQTIAANITIPPLQPEDVEEVASDVFLALWNNAGTVEEGKLKAWLAAVTRNTAKNKLRSHHLALPLEDDYFILDVPDVEDELLAQELKKLTREAVSSLPEPEHSIFVRYYFLYPFLCREEASGASEKCRRNIEFPDARYQKDQGRSAKETLCHETSAEYCDHRRGTGVASDRNRLRVGAV